MKKKAIIKQSFDNESLTYEKVKERIVNLKIYFNELAFTHIFEQEKMSVVDLLANLGGLFELLSVLPS